MMFTQHAFLLNPTFCWYDVFVAGSHRARRVTEKNHRQVVHIFDLFTLAEPLNQPRLKRKVMLHQRQKGWVDMGGSTHVPQISQN